jgi:hypothetical protein
MVTLTQTREEAFGSMRTFLRITDQATEKSYIWDEDRLIVPAIISVGAALIALGPWLTGTPSTLGSWCYHPEAFSAQGFAKELVWMASQHCGYCYLGAAMIGIGSATRLRSGN